MSIYATDNVPADVLPCFQSTSFRAHGRLEPEHARQLAEHFKVDESHIKHFVDEAILSGVYQTNAPEMYEKLKELCDEHLSDEEDAKEDFFFLSATTDELSKNLGTFAVALLFSGITFEQFLSLTPRQQATYAHFEKMTVPQLAAVIQHIKARIKRGVKLAELKARKSAA